MNRRLAVAFDELAWRSDATPLSRPRTDQGQHRPRNQWLPRDVSYGEGVIETYWTDQAGRPPREHAGPARGGQGAGGHDGAKGLCRSGRRARRAAGPPARRLVARTGP